MASYLDSYGEGDEQRLRVIKRSVIAVIAAVVIAVGAYFGLQKHPRKAGSQSVFVGSKCRALPGRLPTLGVIQIPIPALNTAIKNFWKTGDRNKPGSTGISDVDGCPTGVVITVSAAGSQPAPLWVQRSDKRLSFSPWPECQGKRWRFRQFFRRMTRGSSDGALRIILSASAAGVRRPALRLKSRRLMGAIAEGLFVERPQRHNEMTVRPPNP